MGVVFLSYPDEDVRRGWYLVDVDGVAAGPFGRAMGLDLLTAVEARDLGTRGPPLIRRVLSEERLDLIDGLPAAAASPAAVRNGRV